MAALSDMLVSLVKPAIARGLLALGFSSVTISGVDTTVSWLRSYLDRTAASFDPTIMNLFGVAGVWTGLGIIFGAVMFALSYWTLTRSIQLLGVSGA